MSNVVVLTVEQVRAIVREEMIRTMAELVEDPHSKAPLNEVEMARLRTRIARKAR